MGEQGLDLGRISLTYTTFEQKQDTHTKIPWSSQKMQIVLLACLAAALVLVPAANAQGCKPGTSDASNQGKGGAQKKLKSWTFILARKRTGNADVDACKKVCLDDD